MATAPAYRAQTPDDPEMGIRVFNPSKKQNTSVSIKMKDETRRNPKDVIKRFEEEKSYGLGRRRKSRRRVRKSKKTRKH